MSSPITAKLDLPITAAPNAVATPILSPHDEVLMLFDACAPALWRQVRACGVPAESADDVVQDAFVALFHHLRRGGAQQNLRGWLARVSYRLALKHRQRQARRWSRESAWPSDQMNAVPDRSMRIDERMAADAQRRRLHAVFLALPDRGRECLALRAAGLRYREIAETLGISLGLVAKTLARATVKFSNAIKE